MNSIRPVFIGVAGGTGAGKSTLCTALMDKYPEKVGLMQLDDYFKPSAEAPTRDGHTNFDHPDSLYLDKLAKDLSELSQGIPVIVNTKNERLNHGYKETGKRIPVEFHPKPVMLVEGFLVLFDERIRTFLSSSIWLDIDHDARWARRVHFKYPEYEHKVLLPMYEHFVEPTKQYATQVIDASRLSKEQVLQKAEEVIGDLVR